MRIGVGLGLPLPSGASLRALATSQLGGVAPYHYWDFINNRALFAQADVGGVTSTPGWSFARASTGYAETAAGVLVPFASGELRRTDKGVLIEGARTNLLTYSQDFSNAAWSTKSNVTITTNAALAPDGTMTANKVEATSATNSTFSRATTVAATTATYAVYCKKGTGATVANSFILRSDTTATNLASVTLNYDTGVLTQTIGSLSTVQALANGWYRVTLIAISGITSGDSLRVYPGFTGGPQAAGDHFFGWGAQLEAASFPSSYIPTTTASATRAADVLTVSSPGVNYPLGLFAEAERAVDTGSYENILGVDDGTNSNRTLLFLDTSDQVAASARTATVEQLNIPVTGAVAIGAATKSAIRMDTNNAIIARGGTLSALDSTVTLPANPTRVTFSPSQELFGYIRRAAIINFAPSNAQLTAMTT